VISAGSERTIVEFGKGSWLAKARSQPEKLEQVLQKLRTDGVVPTLEAVFAKLDEPLPLGYCNAGVVVEQGAGSREQGGGRAEGSEFRAGDRVVSNGPHAEFVAVPRNLCARIPDGVTDEQAAFTVLGSIGLQGIRLLQPTLGERVVVSGLGLIGLMTVQLLRAHGCDVLGVDLNPRRLALAEEYGARTVNVGAGGDPVAAVNAWTHGVGADGVIITASAKSDELVHQAAQMCRKRGRIVLVGVVGLNLRRSDFYEKELTFQVSCSYGPGRYDEKYEQAGQDYPIGYVRWTEQRNFEAVLSMLASGRLNVDKLITHRFPLADAAAAYGVVGSDPGALGVILQYPVEARRETRLVLREPSATAAGKAVVGVIGAGNFSKMTLMPALAKTPARIKCVCDLNGAAAAHLARKHGAESALTDAAQLLADPEVNAVFVAVGHHLHARFVCEALRAGKHVFVEKPLAMNVEQVREIVATAGSREQGAGGADDRRLTTDDSGQGAGSGEREGRTTDDRRQTTAGRERGAGSRERGAGSREQGVRGQRSEVGGGSKLRAPSSQLLMVGFNRRFSPHAVRMKSLLTERSEPLTLSMTVNAGFIPKEHWVHDPVRGGGRIIGEACHFIDLMVFLTGSLVKTVAAVMMGPGAAVRDDKMSILLGFEDGSVGTVNYFANGSKAYPKELLEVFSQGRVLRLDNFRKTEGYGFRGFKRFTTWRQDKGHQAEFAAFVERVERGGEPLIPLRELVNVTLASFAAVISADQRRTVEMDQEFGALSGCGTTDYADGRG